jgi:hypothetical protein
VRRRSVSREDIAAFRARVPAKPLLVLVVRLIVYPRSDGLPPLVEPRTAAQKAMVSTAYAEMMATGRSRRIILDSHDGR